MLLNGATGDTHTDIPQWTGSSLVQVMACRSQAFCRDLIVNSVCKSVQIAQLYHKLIHIGLQGPNFRQHCMITKRNPVENSWHANEKNTKNKMWWFIPLPASCYDLFIKLQGGVWYGDDDGEDDDDDDDDTNDDATVVAAASICCCGCCCCWSWWSWRWWLMVITGVNMLTFSMITLMTTTLQHIMLVLMLTLMLMMRLVLRLECCGRLIRIYDKIVHCSCRSMGKRGSTTGASKFPEMVENNEGNFFFAQINTAK